MGMAGNFETRRLLLTFFSPLVLHFYIPLPVVLVGLSRKDFHPLFIPITFALGLVSDKISYGSIILHPTTYFTIPATLLFAVILISAIFLTKQSKVWKILIATVILISILHSLTPIDGVNSYGSADSGCQKITIDFLDSETVYCIHSSSAPLSSNDVRTMYHSIAVYPLGSEGMLITKVHLFNPRIVINEFDEVSLTGNGIYHAMFYAKDIHKAVMSFCYYPETIIGTIPVPLCESEIVWGESESSLDTDGSDNQR